MKYLADYAPEKMAEFELDFDTIRRTTGKIPHLNRQISDAAKRKAKSVAGKVVKSKPVKDFIKKHDTLKNRIKLSKAYLRYRKFLGDTYGKEQGMKMLRDQTRFVKDVVKGGKK